MEPTKVPAFSVTPMVTQPQNSDYVGHPYLPTKVSVTPMVTQPQKTAVFAYPYHLTCLPAFSVTPMVNQPQNSDIVSHHIHTFMYTQPQNSDVRKKTNSFRYARLSAFGLEARSASLE